MQPFLVRVEAEITKYKKAKTATKVKKIKKAKEAEKPKVLNGKRKPKPQQAVGKKLLTNNFAEMKKLLPGIGLMLDAPELQSFSETPEWKNFIRKIGPAIITAFFADTKVIKSGEKQQFLRYTQNQVKNPTT